MKKTTINRKEEVKTERVTVKITPSYRRIMDKRSKKAGITVSEFCRRCIEKEIEGLEKIKFE